MEHDQKEDHPKDGMTVNNILQSQKPWKPLQKSEVWHNKESNGATSRPR